MPCCIPLLFPALGALTLTAAWAALHAGQQDAPAAEPAIWERIDLPSVAACGACHEEVYREWAASLHAGAWTNANVQAATKSFEMGECRPCHSPMQVLETGLDLRPEYRDFNQLDGVHCLSCHGLEDGVAAARTLPDAPCRPRFDPRLRRAELCWPCHQPTHQAFDEYEGSDAKALGLRCQDCHMPPRVDRPGHEHGPNGGLNPAFVRRALDWSCRLEAGALLVRLRNRAGHKFPGEIPSRALHVWVRFDEREPETVVLRKPHKREPRADDRLAPDEERTLRFSLPAGVERVEVRLTFRPLPLMPDEAAFLLGAWSWP